MKRLNFAAKNALFLFITGILFLSCTVPENNEYGTLVLTLPGTASPDRAAVSAAFTATLKYRIVCTGPGEETLQAKPGGSIAVPLLPGNWTVTVTVLNAADQEIGSKTIPALVESGKVTQVQLPVGIDTGRKDIIQFTLAGAAGTIEPVTNTITVFVPPGTDLRASEFTLVHTGVAVSPAPGTALNFNYPRAFMVTAENGEKKGYIVTVKVSGDNSSTQDQPSGEDPLGDLTTWPSGTVWDKYGLSGLSLPPDASVVVADDSSNMLRVALGNAGPAAFTGLIAEVKAITGVPGTERAQAGMKIYTCSYGGNTLTMYSFASIVAASPLLPPGLSDPSIPEGVPILILVIESDGSGGPAAPDTWPADSQWAPFNLEGLTQPENTTVKAADAGADRLEVTLKDGSPTAYEDLRLQIINKFGSPYSETGGSGDQIKSAIFSTFPDTEHEVIVELELDISDLSNPFLVIRAEKIPR